MFLIFKYCYKRPGARAGPGARKKGIEIDQIEKKTGSRELCSCAFKGKVKFSHC